MVEQQWGGHVSGEGAQPRISIEGLGLRVGRGVPSPGVHTPSQWAAEPAHQRVTWGSGGAGASEGDRGFRRIRG